MGLQIIIICAPGKGERPTWFHLHVLRLICSHMHSTLLYYFRPTFDLSLSLSLLRYLTHKLIKSEDAFWRRQWVKPHPLRKKVTADPPPMTNCYVIFTLFMNKLLHYFYYIILIIIFHSITPYKALVTIR